MANHKTGAQRYNDRMDKIWDTARKNGALTDKSVSNKAKSKVLDKTKSDSYWKHLLKKSDGRTY